MAFSFQKLLPLALAFACLIAPAKAQEWRAQYAFRASYRNYALFNGQQSFAGRLLQATQQGLKAYSPGFDPADGPRQVLSPQEVSRRLLIPELPEEVRREMGLPPVGPNTVCPGDPNCFPAAALHIEAVYYVHPQRGLEAASYFHVIIPREMLPTGIAQYVATFLYEEVEKMLGDAAPWVSPNNHALRMPGTEAISQALLDPEKMTLHHNGDEVLSLEIGLSGLDTTFREGEAAACPPAHLVTYKIDTMFREGEVPQEIARHLAWPGLIARHAKKAQAIDARWDFYTQTLYDLQAAPYRAAMGDGKLAELLLQGIAEGHITAYRGFDPGFGTSPSFRQPRTPDSLLLIPNVPEHMAPMMFPKESLSLGLGRLQQGGDASLQCFVLGMEGRFDPTGVTRTIAFLKPDEVLAFLAAKKQGPLADAIQQMSTNWLGFTARDPQMHLYEVGHPGSGQAARPFEQGTLEGIDMAEGAMEALKALYRALP